MVKQYGKKVKWYGIMFTCLSSCAMYFEVVQNMETGLFIQALRRFIECWGNIRLIRCDNSSNCNSPNQNTKGAFLKGIKTKYHTSGRLVELIGSHEKNNPPSGSHLGGVCEHQTKSVSVILSALLKQHSTSLNNKSLVTLLTDVESVVNSRPLTVETLSDITSEASLSPINLIATKFSVVLPPPGDFKQPDLQSRQHWRRIQHMVK